jgi:hypothetical protein
MELIWKSRDRAYVRVVDLPGALANRRLGHVLEGWPFRRTIYPGGKSTAGFQPYGIVAKGGLVQVYGPARIKLG